MPSIVVEAPIGWMPESLEKQGRHLAGYLGSWGQEHLIHESLQLVKARGQSFFLPTSGYLGGLYGRDLPDGAKEVLRRSATAFYMCYKRSIEVDLSGMKWFANPDLNGSDLPIVLPEAECEQVHFIGRDGNNFECRPVEVSWIEGGIIRIPETELFAAQMVFLVMANPSLTEIGCCLTSRWCDRGEFTLQIDPGFQNPRMTYHQIGGGS